MLKFSTLAASVASLLGLSSLLVASPSHAFTLTVLHNNDGESQLIDAGSGLEDFGGIARFASQVQMLRSQAEQDGNGVLLLSSGDNFLAGPEFQASLDKGVPFFDSIGLDQIGYDAIAIGNHEFDFGPDVLANFVNGFTSSNVPFLSANLDFSGESNLQALVEAGRIAKSTVAEVNGQQVGIVGATTPLLPFISNPGNVEVDNNVAAAIQAEVDALQADGINKIILISHLQSVEEDLALIPQLQGVDIAIAGGGDELLANQGDLLIPGDEEAVFGDYPITSATDLDGNTVQVVTTSGGYRYVGRLEVEFDAAGKIITVDESSGPVRVAGGDNPDAVTLDPQIQEQVIDPVQAAIAELDANVIGTSEVPLNGLRNSVRTEETNLGNLIADSLLFEGMELADDLGIVTPIVALQNGGGIRNDTVIEAGDLSELDTFDILPFSNFVSLVPNIAAEQFVEILENAVSNIEGVDGRFAQVSGFRFSFNPSETARTLDENGNIITPGERVRRVVLNDGTVLVQGGTVLPDAPSVSIATINFLANGGDQYPFNGAEFTSSTVTYQQALANYIEQELDGTITASQYPAGGEGRIKAVPEPGSVLGILAFGLGLPASRLISSIRKRKQKNLV